LSFINCFFVVIFNFVYCQIKKLIAWFDLSNEGEIVIQLS